MKKTILSILFIGATLSSIHAQKHVYPLPLDSNVVVKGATMQYMLPATAFKVNVTVTRVREIKGHYSDHAERLLGLSNVIQENKTYYSLKGVKISAVQVPDMSQAYLVALSPRQLKDGILCQESQHAAIANTYAVGTEGFDTQEAPIPNFFKNYSDPTYAATEDAFVETKIIDGVVTQVPANKTKLVSKSNIQKAQEAADAISKSRKDQYNLASGEQETPYAAETLQRMMQELKDWENNYLSLFTGLQLEDTITYTFFVTPTGENATIFHFDTNSGLSTSQNAAGDTYALRLSNVLCDDVLNQEIAIKEKQRHGYRFRIAVPMHVTLEKNGNCVYDFGNHNMSQYGKIKILPVGLDQLNINSIGFIY